MRIKLVKLVYVMLVSAIVLRLGYWQIIQADDLFSKGENQRTQVKEIVAPRGDILFSDGTSLATSEPGYLVYLQPKLIKTDKKYYARKIAEILWEEDKKIKDGLRYDLVASSSSQITDDLTKETDENGKIKKFEEDILSKLNQNLYWVSLGRRVNTEVNRKLEKLNFDGIGFDHASLRFYPEGTSSAHLLGFVGSDVYGSEIGYFGIEGYYNGELKGTRGIVKNETDALGLPILIGQFINKSPKKGKDLTLTIDRAIQNIIEEKLRKSVQSYGAKEGSILIMDPKTGGILAMASVPGYDPANPSFYSKEDYKNPLVADSFEPGSTFKVLVMAAGLNEDVVEPDTKCDSCSSPVNLAGFTIRTWNNKYLPNQTMAETIIHSDNTGMVFVAKKLGIEKLFDYIKKFGFGSITGIDLQDETAPPLRPKETWKEIDLATASFGQGISVTPLQLTRAISAIANRGLLMEPKVVSEIKDSKGVVKVNPRIVGQPVTEETAKKITEMMVKAVDEGEAQYFKKKEGVKNYKIAGKTGTAQIPVAGHYDPTKTIASFIGFAPADDPKFVMLIKFVEPSSSIFGAETAAPTFFEIAKELFLYYGIPPSN